MSSKSKRPPAAEEGFQVINPYATFQVPQMIFAGRFQAVLGPEAFSVWLALFYREQMQAHPGVAGIREATGLDDDQIRAALQRLHALKLGVLTEGEYEEGKGYPVSFAFTNLFDAVQGQPHVFPLYWPLQGAFS